MNNYKGNLCFVLHAHLPFVRHPEYSRFLEEDWLYEAINETYLPILRTFRSLEKDSIPFRLTISISPTLCAMLSDKLLQERYIAYVERLLELADKELSRTSLNSEENKIVMMYKELFIANLDDFKNLYQNNILNGFLAFEKSGNLELITTAATHAFLPCYKEFPSTIKAQIQVAMDSHIHHFGKSCKGVWLPECGYYPGVEDVLKNNDINYFFSSAHAILFSEKKPANGVFAPVNCKNGVSVFARDIVSSKSVWSPEVGYPGDNYYRDFYRDIGYDLPLDYISPYIHENKIRVNTGMKYHRITGKDISDKKLYDIEAANKRVVEHAENFIYNRKKQVNEVAPKMDIDPIIVSPFDAELFGHWWFEGPKWLEAVFRKVADEDNLELITPSDYLEKEKVPEQIDPVFSSWGNNGFSEVWIDGSNDWIYPLIHGAVEKMQDLIERFPDESSLKERILNQAAREIMLAQSSDWPFIMYMATTQSYAARRVKQHIANFNRIYNNLSRNDMDTEWVTSIEKENNRFPSIDYRIFEK